MLRTAGYGFGFFLGIPTSVLLLHHLGVEGFAQYATVVALLGIVSGITDAGLTAVGARELALRPRGPERDRLLATILGLRLVVTPVGVVLAVVFAIAAGMRTRSCWHPGRWRRRRCDLRPGDAADAAAGRAPFRPGHVHRRPAPGAHAGRRRDLRRSARACFRCSRCWRRSGSSRCSRRSL